MIVRVVEGVAAMAKHNFDRPFADEAGNIVSAMCSRCGRIVELDGADIPDDIRNEDCEQQDLLTGPDDRREHGSS